MGFLSSNRPCYEFSPDDLPRDRFLRAGVISSPAGLVNSRPINTVFKGLLQGMATGRQHFFLPNSGYLGNQSLRASPVPGVLIRMETPKACVSFSLPVIPRHTSSSCHTALQRELSSGGDPKGGG